MTIEIDAELHRRLFAGINEQGFSPEGWTRAPWTDELRAAEQLVIDAAVAGGMVCEHDPAGNLWITDPQAPADGLVVTGSHLDTVPKGGAFDGTLGVVGGLAAVLALRAAGVPNAERLAVISFADEEGSRFNTPCFGSRTMVGTFGDEVADATDKDGISIRDVGPQDPTKAAGLQRRIGCYFEIHVEQGLALDPADVSLGVATRLSARGRWEWEVVGEANHAGTTPMRLRRDAGYLAASVNLFARKLAWDMGGNQVATVGALSLRPNLINVVPNRAVFAVDLRNTDEARLKEAEARVAAHIAEVAAAERVEVKADVLARFEPVIFDSRLVDRVEHHARALSLGTRRMPSGAGHDAQMMQRLCPTAMIFVPSVAGLSHNVKEHTEAADLAAGAQVLANLMLELAET